VALGVGIGPAFADGPGQSANTFFTELPGVLAKAPVQQAPGAPGANQTTARTNMFATGHSRTVALFPPTMNAGSGS
jgi:hypothetical protein